MRFDNAEEMKQKKREVYKEGSDGEHLTRDKYEMEREKVSRSLSVLDIKS